MQNASLLKGLDVPQALRAVSRGLGAAVRSPRWLSGPRFRSALESEPKQANTSAPDPELVAALRVANGAIRRLARTRTFWRNTCLYRSVAQYLVLTGYGRSAAIRIGVQSGADHLDEKDVAAHSWVLYHGPEAVQDGGRAFEELRFAR